MDIHLTALKSKISKFLLVVELIMAHNEKLNKKELYIRSWPCVTSLVQKS